MNIHTIGDSHAKYGWSKINGVNVHHVGPKLCYSVGRDELKLVDGSLELEADKNNNRPKWIEILQGDMVVFCFGEIDCRCHVHKHVNENTSYQSVIDSIVDGYFQTLKYNESLISDLKIVVYNVPPPCYTFKQDPKESFPLVGSYEDRKKYHEYFNAALKRKCEEYNYIFFDVYDKYKDENGMLKKELSDKTVHIDDAVFIESELNILAKR